VLFAQTRPRFARTPIAGSHPFTACRRGGCCEAGSRRRRVSVSRLLGKSLCGEGESMSERNEIHGILVTLHVGGEQSLFVMLGSDGSINHLGTGSVDNAECELFIGKIGPDVFQQLLRPPIIRPSSTG
jgi:hypothetical protein